MWDEICLYWGALKRDIPSEVYESLLSILCFGTVLLISLMGKKAWRAVPWLILVEYTSMLYCTTVLYRPVSETYNYDFTPFWSYAALQSGREELFVENIMNVVVFVPIGVLIGCAIGVLKWWKVLLIGGFISSSIELLQLLYKRGFAETDDVIHNVLGCMIGYRIYSLVRVGYEKISKRDMAVL